MERGLQISLKRYALSMEDKMAAGDFGRATNYEMATLIFQHLTWGWMAAPK